MRRYLQSDTLCRILTGMKKVIAGILIYLFIGVMFMNHRRQAERWSYGGPEIIIVVAVYPFIWPYAEAVRLLGAVEERAFRSSQRNEEVALLCPPAFDPLFREALLARRRDIPAASYEELLKTLRRVTLDLADPRTGLVLDQTAFAARAMGDISRARNDARDFSEKAQKTSDTSALWVAAAILRGARAATRGDAELSREILAAYERIYETVEPTETPFAAYAMGTAYEACGRQDEALAHYGDAIRSGRLDLAMQALIRALPLAGGDSERLDLVRAFAESLSSLERWIDEHLERSLAETGWGDYSRLTWYGRRYEAFLVMGRHLFPLYPAETKGARRFDAMLLTGLARQDMGGIGRCYEWWEELIVTAEPTFSAFPAKLDMVESLLDVVLALKERGETSYTNMLGQEVREVYYRLYDETRDIRWLDSAVESQLRLRPSMRAHEKYLLGEIALMKGEYRKHFDLTARRYLEGNCDYTTLPSGFIGRKMRNLEIQVDGDTKNYYQALNDHLGLLSSELYDNLGLGNAQPWERKLRAYEAGELSPPFHDFADADVFAATVD